MDGDEQQENRRSLAADRATEIRNYIERLISLLGEHPECELKREWPRNTPYHKAEMVKDIQATANSAIALGKEKYIVVGGDQQTRAIVGCNPVDYDDASIRQLLEQYLDPVPEFEVLSLKSRRFRSLTLSLSGSATFFREGANPRRAKPNLFGRRSGLDQAWRGRYG
jgi:hypothetical protein